MYTTFQGPYIHPFDDRSLYTLAVDRVGSRVARAACTPIVDGCQGAFPSPVVMGRANSPRVKWMDD